MPDTAVMRDGVLSANGIGVAFAGLRALNDVSLEVRAGEVIGLIGPNGAGKTTMVNVLTGFQAPTAGAVMMEHRKMNGLRAHEFRRSGISRTFQAGRLFKELSVLDNLAVAATALGARRAQAEEEAWNLIEQFQLKAFAHRHAGGLPYTDERRVGIARALMHSPQFLLLDEPAAGMSDHEATDLSRVIKDIAKSRGCGVLLIEHNVRMVLETCGYIVVLDSGEVIERGTPEIIKNSAVVRHAYMGSAAPAADAVSMG